MGLLVEIQKDLGPFRLDVGFSAQGGVTGLLGASGCGKSLTLKCIAGVETPDRGHIELDGRVLFDHKKRINLPPQKRQVGYLFQNYALFPNMTVEQNIACGVRDRARRKEEAARLRVHPLIWGCDFCQRACPYNAAPAHSPLPEFSTSLVDALENSDLEGLTNRTFRDKYGGRAFAWRGPGPLRRNLGLKEE